MVEPNVELSSKFEDLDEYAGAWRTHVAGRTTGGNLNSRLIGMRWNFRHNLVRCEQGCPTTPTTVHYCGKCGKEGNELASTTMNIINRADSLAEIRIMRTRIIIHQGNGSYYIAQYRSI